MQISTAAKASKKLRLEGSCSRHSAKCPAWKGCGLPAENDCKPLCQPAAWCHFLAEPRRDAVAELPDSSEVCRPFGLG